VCVCVCVCVRVEKNLMMKGRERDASVQLALCEEPALMAAVMARALERQARANAGAGSWCATVFDAVAPPAIGLREYLERVLRFARCSEECLILAMVYVDRAARRMPQLAPTAVNVHRLVLAATTLAAKFSDDIFYSNAFYARVGGVPLREMNALEIEMLAALDFRLLVAPDDALAMQYALVHAALASPSLDSHQLQFALAQHGLCAPVLVDASALKASTDAVGDDVFALALDPSSRYRQRYAAQLAA